MAIETKREGYLISLLCLACVAGLTLLFMFLSVHSGENYSSALLELLLDVVPHMIVALLATPVVYFFLQRQGIIADSSYIEPQEHPRSEAIVGTEGKLRWQGTISWQTAYAAVDGLMEKIQNEGYAFDCVVTLADGGLVVADLLLFNRKFRARKDLHVPVICLNLKRTFDHGGKHVEIEIDSYPVEYARRFSKLLIVDEASRSGKTIDAVLSALQDLYKDRGLPAPEMRVAMLGILAGGSPCSNFHELTLQGGQTYPWGPFAEHWANMHQ